MSWVIKIGTSTITDSHGEIDDEILTNLLKDIKGLSDLGEKIIIISSGAVACGRQVLNSSNDSDNDNKINDKKEESEKSDFLTLRTHAAIGQPYLYQKYQETLSQYQIITSQILLQDHDFSEDVRRHSIKTMLNNLLDQGIIPILNENDAITVRQEDYRDKIGKILWDNDSLATLVAKTIGAKYLLLCSNIDGVYNQQQDIIQIWRPEYLSQLGKLETSNYGRGGIISKVQAAMTASQHGIQTYIINGKTPNIISKIYLKGVCHYTYFPVDVSDTQSGTNQVDSSTILENIKDAKLTSLNIRATAYHLRCQWLLRFREQLIIKTDKIIKINKQDLRLAKERDISKAMYHRLVINENSIANLVNGITSLTNLPDPVHRILETKTIKHPFLVSQNLEWSRSQIPLGLIMVIFESRPDVLVQLLALAVLSGNALVLKGGKEAFHTLNYLFSLFIEVIPIDLLPAYHLFFSREEAGLALASKDLDLCIPRGSRHFIQWVKSKSVAPVIGHGEGICCAYLHSDLDPLSEEVVEVISHSKLDYPAACNALEVVLINQDCQDHQDRLGQLFQCLTQKGITIFTEEKFVKQYPTLKLGKYSGAKEHGSASLVILTVPSIGDAISYIQENGSCHTDLILTKDVKIVQLFMSSLQSSCLFHNCSTRCADGYRMEMGCEVGINTESQSWFRGPVGVEALMTTQIQLRPVKECST